MNRHYVANREQSVRNMARLRRILYPEVSGITLLPGISDRYFVLRSAHGEILVSDPMDQNFGLARHPAEEGLARLTCSFDLHHFYYSEVVVQTVDDILEMIQFHLMLERFQRGTTMTNTLYVSSEHRNHRFLPSYRNRNQHGWGYTIVPVELST